MKNQLKKMAVLAGLLAASVSVSQAQWYLAGDFQGWCNNCTPMTPGPNSREYSYTISGMTAGTYGNVKVTDGTWDNTWPSQNMVILYDGTGSATVHFWPGNIGDGWQPTANRVGYDDPNNDLGWGIAGDFNGWDGTQNPLVALGNGIYSNTVVIATAGTYGFKFQSPAGSWSDIYFGSDFGNNGANGSITTTNSSQTVSVVLDLPNGRWFVGTTVPQWCLAGVFNGWNASANPMTPGPNSGEYSYTITGGTAGTYDDCKVTDGTWNNSWPPGNNLVFLYDSTGSATIHFWPGAPLDGWTPTGNRVGYDDPDNDAGWGIAGDFNGWDGTQNLLNSIGNGVYSNSVVVATAGIYGFKFQSPAGNWTDIYFGSDFDNNGNNGSYTTTTSPQTVPVVLDLTGGRYYLGTPAVAPTNYITFQLDMSEQVAIGNFTNGFPGNSVAVGGIAGDWGTDNQLTNYTILNPGDLNPGLKTNLYIGIFPLQIFLPTTISWKFRVNNLDSGYELPLSTAGQNRQNVIISANQVLPVLYYDDVGPGDLVLTDTVVTFSIYVTNGTATDAGGTFTKGSDTVWVSGGWLGWPAWGYDALPANQQMFESSVPDVYTNSLVVPRGSSIAVSYKYSFDGVDNENGANTNHIRYIRTYATNYAFPQDVWSWTLAPMPYPNPGITSTNIVEPSFGYLAAGVPSGGSIPITWLGRPGVVLENSSSLTGGSWNINTATDGSQSINWPISGTQFFRLMQYSQY